MNRRKFLATAGMAAATPALTQTSTHDASSETKKALFNQVDFTSDGLALNPREYTTLLGEVAAQGLEPDNYSLGGSVAKLEQQFARLLGKEAAMFVPTGTLANHLAIRKLAGEDRRVLVQAESHFYNDGGDCAQTLSSLNLIPLGQNTDQGNTITLAEVKRWVERSAGGRVATKVGVVSIESPVRRQGHAMVEFGELERICGYTREQGIRLHLDGARLFNLPFHSGKSVRQYASLFDTVYVSLWKHFNAASGAILAGDASFIDGLFHVRRMFGGALPHAWPQIALVAKYAEGYEQEYAKSWQSADQLIAMLKSDGRFKIGKVRNGTSKFFLSAAIAPELLLERALKSGVVLAPAADGMFAMQVNATILRMPTDALARVFIDATKS